MLNELLNQLSNDYEFVNRIQRRINKKYHGKSLMYKGESKYLEDAFNFKFDNVKVAEDTVEIVFSIIESEEEVDCVDYISFNEFIDNFELMEDKNK